MEADILESKKDLYLVQKYGGRYFEKVLFINLFYFVVSVGITACSIIIDEALVIEAAERYFVYFIATKLMSLASYSFHFEVHLFIIYWSVFIVFMLDVILDYILFYSLGCPPTFFIIFDVRIHLGLNPFERCVPVLAKKSEKIEITYFWPGMTYVR